MQPQQTAEGKATIGGRGGVDGPDGAGATQFHGVFSADVSVVTHARVQFGHWQGWWIDPRVPLWKKKMFALHAHFQGHFLWKQDKEV